MIYELAVVCRGDATDETAAAINGIVKDVVSSDGGEILVQDNWGRLSLAQPTSEKETKGLFLYYLYQSNGQQNKELTRRFGINESVSRHMVLVLGDDTQKEAVVKGYKTPYSKTHKGSVLDSTDEDGAPEEDLNKDRKRFAKRRSCWFTARKIKADWKDPATYSWLVNEFGKISPARVSGIARKHQRYATDAIKRARQLGIASHLSGKFAE